MKKKVRFTEEYLARDRARILRLNSQTECSDDIKVKDHSKTEGNNITEVGEATAEKPEIEVAVTEQGKWKSVTKPVRR